MILAMAAALLATQDAAAPRERIVVTATREERSAVETPGAVARLDAEEISRVDAQHVQELLNRAPGVNLHRGSGQEHLTAIRSPVLTGGAGAGSFLYLEDGVPLRAAGFANVNGLFEAMTELAEGVEITRGPGSALYGSNAVHGLVNVLTPEPGGDEVAFRVSAGSFGRSAASASANARLGGARSYFALAASHEDGWRAAAGLDEQKLLARVDAETGSWSTATSLAFTNLNQETAGFVAGPDAYRDPIARRTNENAEAYRDAKAFRLQSRWTRDLDASWSLSITPYARWNDMAFLQHFLPSKALEESGHQSLGSLFAATWRPDADTRLNFGADVEATRGWLSETQSLPSFGSFPQGAHYDYDVDAFVVAAYATVERALTTDLTVNAGVRAESIDYRYDTAIPAGVSGRFLVPESREDSFTLFTPKLALIWRTADDAAAYVRYARGQRAPQTSDLYRLQIGQFGRGAGVETLDSVEAGWRGSVGRAYVDASAYAMRKSGYFFRDADGFNVPDGRTRHQGVEVSLEAPLTETIDLRLGASYARHTYAFDRPVSANATESVSKGDDIDTAPRWLADAILLWRPSAAASLEFEWSHVGGYFMDAANSQVYPGHDLFNLRGRIQLNRKASAYAAVRNVFDVAYAERADFAFGNERYFPGEDRAFTIGLDARF